MSGLMRRSPLEALERQMEPPFDRVFRGRPTRRPDTEHVGQVPPLDMADRRNELLLRADLPGVDRQDIRLSVESGVLARQGSRRQQREDTDDDVYAMERWAGPSAGSIALPQGVDPDPIEASFKNGDFEIHIPKTKESKGKKIEIKAA